MVYSACGSSCTQPPCYLQVITPHMIQPGFLHQTLMLSFLPAYWTYPSISGVRVYSSTSFMKRDNQENRLHYLSSMPQSIPDLSYLKKYNGTDFHSRTQKHAPEFFWVFCGGGKGGMKKENVRIR